MKSIPFNPRRIHLFLRFSLGVRVTEHPRDGGALERYGGHAKNIAGHVIFLAENQDVRHMSADDIEQLLGMGDEESE